MAPDQRRLWEPWRRFVVLLVVGGAAALWGALYGLGCIWEGFRQVVFVDADHLTTLLQVVPATVVAVFVFAAGAVFVVAQVIYSPLGSRGVEELLVSRRVFAAVVVGVVLLMASLALVVAARPPNDATQVGGWFWPFTMVTVTEVTEPAVELADWAASAGSALAVATAAYAPIAIWGIVVVLSDFVQPERYTARLVSAVEKWRSPSQDDLYRRVRALRQWLRISCGSGESRDLTFAVLGMRELVIAYMDVVEGDPVPIRASLRTEPPSEYGTLREIVLIHWRSSEAVPGQSRDLLGWFGDEFGRACARSLETGILSGSLLLRDADRLLGLMCWAVRVLSGAEPRRRLSATPSNDQNITGPPKAVTTERPVWTIELPEEAGYVLDRIAEIGLFGRLAPDSRFVPWCFRSTSYALLELACGIRSARTVRDPLPPDLSERKTHLLADRAFAGWILVVSEELRRTAGAEGTRWPPENSTAWLLLLRRIGLAQEVDEAYGRAGVEPTERPPSPEAECVLRLVYQLAAEVRWLEAGRADIAPEDALKQLTEVVVGIARAAREAKRR